MTAWEIVLFCFFPPSYYVIKSLQLIYGDFMQFLKPVMTDTEFYTEVMEHIILE